MFIQQAMYLNVLTQLEDKMKHNLTKLYNNEKINQKNNK